MIGRLRTLGIVLAVFSLVFVAAGAFTLIKVNDGRNSLQAFSAAQNIKLTLRRQGPARRRHRRGWRGDPGAAQERLGLQRRQLRARPQGPARQHAERVHGPDGHHRLPHPQQHADGRPPGGRHGRGRHGLQGGHLPVPRRRPLLQRVQPGQPDRGQGSRPGLVGHRSRPDRGARRRHRDRHEPPDGARPRRPCSSGSAWSPSPRAPASCGPPARRRPRSRASRSRRCRPDQLPAARPWGGAATNEGPTSVGPSFDSVAVRPAPGSAPRPG